MSFVTAIKDYIELVNSLYDSISGDLSVQKLIQHSFVYFFETLKYILIYFLSFQWFRDLVYLPIIVPQLSLGVLKEQFVLEDPTFGFSFLLQSPIFNSNKFFIGFFNSFFLCLPISCSNFIVLRRLLIQGIPAGIAAGFGSILSQWLFLVSLFFGVRIFFIPWISLDSFQYVLGLFFILAIVYSMSHERQLTRVKSSAFPLLFKIFSINFLLGWTEQSCLFQYIGNLTLNSEPTILETINAKNQFDFFLIHISYLTGILLGSVFFSLFLGFLAYRLIFFFINITGALYTDSIEKINFILLTAIIALSLASIPYYGLDYLFTNPLGFVSQDKGLEETFISQTQIKDPQLTILPEDEPGIDLAPFDRGRYLYRNNRNNSFEELNYQGEYAWKTREHRKKAFSRQNSEDFFFKWIKKLKKSKIEQPFDEVNDYALQPKNTNIINSSNKENNLGNVNSNEPNKNEKNLEIDDLDFTSNLDSAHTQDNFIFTHALNDRNAISFLVEDTLFNFTNSNFLEFQPDETDSETIMLEKKIKQQYYSNPVYKKLLQTDIDLFLSRQPVDFLLSSGEEQDLFEKRLILSNYYDTLRDYTQWYYAPQFQKLFNGSKSYSNQVYNQQFKGTLQIVRRLFSIDDLENTESQKRILKYDQSLFKKNSHVKEKTDNFIIKDELSPLFHEELTNTKKSHHFQPKSFLETAQSKPFYAGWDEKERKFVITNRFLPRSIAGKCLPFEKNTNNQHLSSSEQSNFKQIKFTAWPLNPELIEKKPIKTQPNSVLSNNFKHYPALPYTFLFDSLNSPELVDLKNTLSDDLVNTTNEKKLLSLSEIENIPTNLKSPEIVDKFTSFFDAVAPKRGGFLWPGCNLKMNFSSLNFKK